ncbi:TetR/AcrR family transcriptional regulator [Alteromonas oceanisediminis]|uniref:TetR/AcrR family transcriptional regulator n=1 Tax=Alteromonas oceanisediminis TaxID=2836180 RepID=UPI001BDB111A|nr:TetR/AcrR family transcriptional regulator [Alteromonas oceanisediminis]MBT0587448.1 TetR/AcrR family transcriptional regulator [Alteromonas oceanisediminis]
MKTAQRILATSLALFNEHGESSVTSVDIANELDISPGNLYYHFKGKEQIVDALYSLHRSQMEHLLSQLNSASLNLEESFYYFYLLLEKLHLYRFLYRSPLDLMEKYPMLRKGHHRMVSALERALLMLMQNAVEQKSIRAKASELPSLVELCSAVMLQSSQYYQIKQKFDEETQIYSALGLLLALLLPRITIDSAHLSQLQNDIAAHTFSRHEQGVL